MTCTVCPNCGLDLEKFAPVQRGDLDLQAHQICWRGQKIQLSITCRLLVSALVRADGQTLTNTALIEAMGYDEVRDQFNSLKVLISRTRKAFKVVDPVFDAIETVWGAGYRWAA